MRKRSTRLPDFVITARQNLSGWLPWLICLLAITTRLAPGARTIDDSYITYLYARNIVAGNGFVYNPGEQVLGQKIGDSRAGLLKDPRFWQQYNLRQTIPTDIYGSQGMLILERKD